MKNFLFAITILLLPYTSYSQSNLNGNPLDEYTYIKLPSNKQIVGSKWVQGLGSTTAGLPDDQLDNSQSLDVYALNNTTKNEITLSLKSILGLSAYTSQDVSIDFGNLTIVSAKDMYSLNLVKDESIVYSAIKASSIKITFKSNIEAKVESDLKAKQLLTDASINANGKRSMNVFGKNLYVAYKIVKIKKVSSDEKSSKLEKDFTVKNLMGYNISFNNSKLVNSAMKIIKTSLGEEKASKIKNVSYLILEYSATADPISMSIDSRSNGGSLGLGMYSNTINFCYCKSQGDISGRLFLINKENTGSKITYDYILIDDYFIELERIVGVTTASGGDFFISSKPNKSSRVTILRKSFFVENVKG